MVILERMGGRSSGVKLKGHDEQLPFFTLEFHRFTVYLCLFYIYSYIFRNKDQRYIDAKDLNIEFPAALELVQIRTPLGNSQGTSKRC